MVFYNASDDLWYQYFNASNGGARWFVLLSVYGLRALWANIGMLFNFGVVYITVKSKSLRSACHILIAIESGLAIILDFSFNDSFLVVLSGTKFVRYEYCFWALLMPCLFGDMAQMMMVLTGMDRLCAVMFPIWYKKRNVNCSFCLIAVVLFCHATYLCSIYFLDYMNSQNFMVSCATNEMGNGGYGQWMKTNGLTLSSILMVEYSLCWFIVFKYAAKSQYVTANNRKLLKSLIFIIVLNLCGVFIKCSVNMLFQSFVSVSVFVKTAFSIAFSFLTIAVYSANAPVLYVISNEYRAQFNQHFPWISKLLCCCAAVEVVVSTSTTVLRP